MQLIIFLFVILQKQIEKMLRDSVEIATKSFSKQLSNFNRSQILFYLAENLQQREKTFVDLLIALKGMSLSNATKEFSQSCERLFYLCLYGR